MFVHCPICLKCLPLNAPVLLTIIPAAATKPHLHCLEHCVICLEAVGMSK